MKLEKLENISKKQKGIYILVGFIIAIIFIVLINIIISKALYRDTKEIEIANGNINYKNSDIKILAVNIEQEDGTYKKQNDIPLKYTLYI